MEWIQGSCGNEVWHLDQAKRNYISYQPFNNETAIVVNNGERYLILAGNHKVEYELVASRDGFGGCLNYFKEHRDQENGWSDGLPNE